LISESALVRGLSGATRRQGWFDGRNVTRPYWNDARILTLAELPPVQMHLISRPDRPWGTLADRGTIATAVALANAVLDAAGEHCVHIVPNPDSVKAIL
jgi:nicotinate dehydrogenase subunit B